MNETSNIAFRGFDINLGMIILIGNPGYWAGVRCLV